MATARAGRVARKAPLTGCLDRGTSGAIAAAYQGIVQPIIQINWDNLQAVVFGPLTGTGLAQIDAAVTNGVPFKIRLIMGLHAPTGANSLWDAGPIPTLTDGTSCLPATMTDKGSPAATHGQVPAIETTAYRRAVNDLYIKLMQYKPNAGSVILDQHPLLRDHTFSEPSTIFAEFNQRGFADTAAPGGLNAATIAQLVARGFTSNTDYNNILGCIQDAFQSYPLTLLSVAFNQFDRLQYGNGPQAATASTSTSITTAGGYPISGFQPAVAWVGYGRYRINSITTGVLSNDTVTLPAGANLAAVVAGDVAWIGGKTYSVAAVNNAAHTVRMTVSITTPTNETGGVLMLWPGTLAGLSASYLAYGSFVVTANTAGVLTIAGGPTVANAFNGLEVIVMNATGSDEVSSDAFMAACRQTVPARTIFQNNGVRSATNLAQAAALNAGSVFPSFRFYGGLRGAQTAGDTVIGDATKPTNRPLQDVIANLIANGYIFCEMPAGYTATYTAAANGATSSADNTADRTHLAVQGAPGWAQDQFGYGSGGYGILTMAASGNQYYVDNDESTFATKLRIFQQVGNPAQTTLVTGVDDAANLGYTAVGHDYLTPAQCAAYNVQFAANYTRLMAAIRTSVLSTLPQLIRAGSVLRTLTGTVNPAFGQATGAGHAVVAAVASNQSTAITCSDPTWTMLPPDPIASPVAQLTLWYKLNCLANEVAPTWTNAGGNMVAALAEFSGGLAAPVVTGSAISTGSPLSSLSGQSYPGSMNELQICAVAWRFAANDPSTAFGHSSGWTDLANNGAANVAQKLDWAYRLTSTIPFIADTPTCTPGSTSIQSGAGIVAAFPLT